MSGARPAEILRQLAPPDAAGPDRELLRRFAAIRDQGAFAELVRRHGPVVLAVCRRVAGHPQDAEDAFQAVFLVLARKAAAVSNPELLGNWLYGVALRVAQKARRSAARRRAREVQVTAMPDPPSSHTEHAADVGPVLHEELNRLPGWYRDAVILCDLRGIPRTEAAKVLGIPEGTLSSRLATGRKKLADRLARRGVVLSAAAVPLVLGEGRAAVPDDLLRQTCGLVADWAAGGAVPGPVGRLAEGGLTVRKSLLIGAFVAAVTAGVTLAARSQSEPNNPPVPPALIAERPADPNPAPAAIPGEKPDDKLVPLGPPKLRKAIDLRVPSIAEHAWSPDGKALAIRYGRQPGAAGPRGTPKGGGPMGPPGGDAQERNTVLYIPDVTADLNESRFADLPPAGTLVGFSPDGKEIYTAVREYDLVSGFHKLQAWTVPAEKVAADERGELKLARTIDLDSEQTHGYYFAPDGKTFRTVYQERRASSPYGVLEVREVNAGTGKTTRTLARVEGDIWAYVVSPDGKRLVVCEGDGKGSVADRVIAYDAETGKKISTGTIERPVSVAVGPPALGGGGAGAAGGGFGGGPGTGVGGLGGGGPGIGRGPLTPNLAISADGRKTVIQYGVGRPQTYHEVGGPYPALAGTDLLSAVTTPDAFSPDGRLVVLTGQRYASREVGKGDAMRTVVQSVGQFLTVWDVDTGKVLRSWDSAATAGFLPNKPVLAVFENNGAGGTRLGLWDFAAEAPEKK
jgi:RNA polymerase sigma factor (sigma-70 family)